MITGRGNSGWKGENRTREGKKRKWSGGAHDAHSQPAREQDSAWRAISIVPRSVLPSKRGFACLTEASRYSCSPFLLVLHILMIVRMHRSTDTYLIAATKVPSPCNGII